jgi:Mg2+-importing ATPase
MALVVLTLAIPYMPLGGVFGFRPLPGQVLATVSAMTILYIVAAEVTKSWFYRHLA